MTTKKAYKESIALSYVFGEASGFQRAVNVYNSTRECPSKEQFLQEMGNAITAANAKAGARLKNLLEKK